MSYLVTGGMGFIGSHVVSLLKTVGRVTTFDAYHIYKPPIQLWFSQNMGYRHKLTKGAESLYGNTINRESLKAAIEHSEPKVIVHLAALPIANLAQRDPKEAFENIIVGTHNLLSVLQEIEFAGLLVYISSSMVYGSFVRDPVREDDQTNPIGVYGGAKLAGEILVKAYANANPFSYIVIRPSAVYGPSDNNLRVVQLFLHTAISGKPITLYVGNDMRMDFTYVEDIAKGIWRAATSNSKFWNNTFNMTYGQARTLWELVDIIRLHFPNLEIVTKPDPNSFRPMRGSLDIQRAKDLLGYRPKYSLESGIGKYIEYLDRWVTF